MSNLTKKEIADEIYGQTGFSRKGVVVVVQMTLDAIMRALAKGRNAELRNVGVFEVRRQEARVGRNPAKPEIEVPISAQAVVKFKAAKTLRHLFSKIDLAGL